MLTDGKLELNLTIYVKKDVYRIFIKILLAYI